MPNLVDLIASYWTIAGDVYVGGPTEASPHDFTSRVQAAAEAGFAGMGFVHADLMAVSGRMGLRCMRDTLTDYGIRIVELEFLTDWFADGSRRQASDAIRRDLLVAAEVLGARQIKVCGDITRKEWPLEHMAAAFRDLCTDGKAAGTRVALEIMPFCNFDDIKLTLRMLEEAGAENGGFLLDLWHLVRGKVPFEDIRLIPVQSVVSVELDDAPATWEGSMWDDTIHGRCLCGQGSFPIAAFLRELRGIGYSGPYGVEILSRELRRVPLREAARRAYQTTMTQLLDLTVH
jgi:sugar phosphate isomerase/epimerase